MSLSTKILSLALGGLLFLGSISIPTATYANPPAAAPEQEQPQMHNEQQVAWGYWHRPGGYYYYNHPGYGWHYYRPWR